MSRKIITAGSVLGEARKLNEKKQTEGAARVERDLPGALTQGPDSSLWTYATRVYDRPEVAAACLRAQDDFGLDVNLLLFAAWLAEGGIALDTEAVTQAADLCAAWRSEVVHPLRRTRRAWRESPPHADAYAAVKAMELEAERRQLGFLEGLGLRLAGGELKLSDPVAAIARHDVLFANLALVAGSPAAESLLGELVTALGRVP